MDKDSGKLVSGGAAAEAQQALVNLRNVLVASGSDIEKVVKVTIFVTDLNEFASVNEEYKKGMLEFWCSFPIQGVLPFNYSILTRLPGSVLCPSG